MGRISGLSDELLVKILRLVPTKVAVSTSILSKRWECLWMWLPKLKILLDVTRLVSLPSLKTLRLHKSLTLRIPDNPHIDGFMIETPALKYFKLSGNIRNDHYCSIENMPNLIEAHLDVEFPDINSVIGSITSVKQSYTMFKDFVFNQLERLEHHKPIGKPQERDILVYILKHSLRLKTATIKSSELEVPKFEMLKELSLSSRASAACQLMFE
ncbi:hypothetical protein F2Q68_00041538 [Brassica cretica]|uniref:FBD domain-containing protein n=1 Tax=Brassica cretica TaxID=69181 RepID=A0A8S9ML11_BRACR|nr:hypothetical protein F2Q68_00041538 [Brassica cretica]